MTFIPAKDEFRKRTGNAPKKGSKWNRKEWQLAFPPPVVRVMSEVIEGYVMVRLTGCIPFVVKVSEWHNKFKPVEGS